MIRTESEKYQELPEIRTLVDDGINYGLFPEITKDIVDFVVKASEMQVEEDIVLPAVMNAFAFIVNSKRITLLNSQNRKNPFLNLYTIIFAPSGAGKDFPSDIITNELLYDINLQLENSYSLFESRYCDDPRSYLDIPMTTELKKKDLQKLLDDNPLKGYSLATDSGTDVGFREMTSSYEKWGIGTPMFRISEFSSYIGDSTTGEKKDFLNDLLNAYNRGVQSGKTTGNRNKVLKAGDTPCVLIAGTSLALVEDTRSKEDLLRWLNGGFARRATIVYIEETEDQLNLDADEFELIQQMQRLKAEASDLRIKLINEINGIYDGLRLNGSINVSDEANLLLAKYGVYLRKTSPTALLSTEYKDRKMRALNIAGILSLIRNPRTAGITLLDVMASINYVEYYGAKLEDFLSEEMKTFAEKVYAYLLIKPLGATSMEIRNKRFVGWNRFSSELRNSIEEIQELANNDSKELREIKDIKGKRYVLVDIDEPKKVLKTADIEYGDDIPIMVSELESNDFNMIAKNTLYKKVMVNKNDLVSVIKSKAHMVQLNDGYRSKKHFIPGGVLIGIDIDEEMSIQEALEFLENNKVKSVIVTSASHQKTIDKEGNAIEPKDKFHIYMLLNKPFTGTPEQWSDMVSKVHEDMEGKADRSCKDVSRFFFASPEDAEVYYVNGDGLDWEAYLKKEQKKADVGITKGRKPLMVNTDYGSDDKATPNRIATKFANSFKKGNRNACMFASAKWMHDSGFSDKEIEVLLVRLNNESPDPLPQHEVNNCLVNRDWSK